MVSPGEVVRLTEDAEVPEYARGRLGMVARLLQRRDGSTELAVQISMGGVVVVPKTATRSSDPIH